ncbi:Wzz/FepE/Etk N-terminal domain-containing protein [Aliarcobacter cryaerophilus]|uniref:Wzz/FepE/Etk N-terminal domain-containing protein n=1 Tax=Aliarcobacter cryaerophilus TaxID=28198 RepID=UPI0036F20C2B
MSEKIVNYEDEIDLRELIKTLWIYKYLILIFTSFITILSIIYVLQKIQHQYTREVYIWKLGQSKIKIFNL